MIFFGGLGGEWYLLCSRSSALFVRNGVQLTIEIDILHLDSFVVWITFQQLPSKTTCELFKRTPHKV